MPTPDRTSLPEIVAAGQHLLRTEGLDAVTMAAVAARVGVRPPSLYKRVRDRRELVGLVARAAAADLGEAIAQADPGTGDPRHRLDEILGAVRSFARTRSAEYALVMMPAGAGVELTPDVLVAVAAPLFAVVTELAAPEHALEAARTVTAWATGFIAMELSGSFRMGGEVDAAFDYGVARLADAIAVRPG